MLVIPAIDLRGGKCVRLRHGDPGQQTLYDEDPVERARSFAAAGARRLHVVDLDGAFGKGENHAAIARICAAVDIPVQTGGGIRSLADARKRFEAGASFVILGTLLVEDPPLAREIAERFPDAIIAGVDARGQDVAVRGWLAKNSSSLSRDELVREMASWGIERIIFTEISRDGTGEGYDLAALRAVAGAVPGLRITASGGARALEDVIRLRDETPPNVDSCIIGRALYEGTIDLAQALAATSPPER